GFRVSIDWKVGIFRLLQHRIGDFETMSGFPGLSFLGPKGKNAVVAGGLTAFVFGVYFYTMKAVGGTDELQMAIDKFEDQKQVETDPKVTAKV
ncbi:unnamed protein product, partial [Brassica rapa subsp. narinosa]